MRIFSARLLAANLPKRICITSNASMSSSNSPATSSPSAPIKNPTRKRESFRSILASIFGGKVDPANPEEPPIDADHVNFPDIVEQTTGEGKLLLLAFENGIYDPYCNLPTERNGRGTKDNPIPIESFINERTIACVCEETQNHVKYTTIYKNEPKRCQCGHWLKLVEAPKFWEKIPKEDLVTIPYFRDLEEEGLLDSLLSGELDALEEEAEAQANKHH